MRKMWIVLLTLALLSGAVAAAEGTEAPAAIRRTGEVTLGTSGIRNPDPPADRDAAWSGNFVTFGEYDGKPIRFRVLQKDSTAYTETPALFLDSDALLFESVFDEGKPYSNSWSGSSLQKLLNGEFLAGFDAREQAAVALSTGNGGISWPGDLPKDSWWGVPVSIHDRVFLLDHAEVRNEAYGYTVDSGFHKVEGKSGSYGHPVPNRKKTGEVRSRCWVLRTASAENSENRGWHVVSVLYDGSFYTETAADAGVYSGSGTIGVAPALNVDQRQILLAEKTGENEYKLTLIEEELTAAVPEGQAVSLAGRTVTVPCAIGGADAGETTGAAVMILDRKFTVGNTNGAALLHYAVLDEKNAFDLPESLDPEGWETDYQVYLIAENLNGGAETDYASLPAPLHRPGTIPAAGEIVIPPEKTEAPFEKDAGNTGLGTAGIEDPVPGGENETLWSGNCVYFGKYNGKPIRFRVLQKDSVAYTEEKALFLDSDEALFVDAFDKTEPVSGVWADSDLRAALNGPFLEAFTAAEQAAIAMSRGDGGRIFSADAPEAGTYGAPVPVEDRVFLPDAADVTSAAYGYSPDPGWKFVFLPGGGVSNHIKAGMFSFRWLRSAVTDKPGCAADVCANGNLGELEANCRLGVAPALNVDQRCILFATEIIPETFKLTLLEEGLEIAVPEGQAVSLAGRTVTVPCEIGGAAAGETTRASVLILDKAWTAGNENGAGILYYGLLDGSFDLPEGLDPAGWGKDWFVYLLAENRRGAQETDDASAPAALEAPGKVSRSYWKMYWKPGEYAIQLTPEEEGLLSGIIQEADRRSAGTMARYGAEHESDLEMMAEGFLQLSPDGTPIEDKRNEYDDIGYYRWAPGLPDEGSVRMETAWKAALKCLLDQGLATPETLVSYYPMFSYEMGNDPENPVWRFIPVCCDASQPQLPRMPWEITVYAHDGSICGYRDYQPES